MKSAADGFARESPLPTGADHNPSDALNASATPGVSSSAPCNVVELLANCFVSSPNRPAVLFREHVLSRTEVSERSGRLAAWLTRNGAGRGSLVGIYMERSVEMLVAVLAVMKAGAAYVPLDPAFPRVRLEQILGETDVSVLLTLKLHLQDAPEVKGSTICLDRDEFLWAAESPHRSLDIGPEERAYVIFTSGSTGRPKGVEVTHGSVVNLLMSAASLLDAGPNERLVAITTLAFDISVLELLLPLVSGGTVVIASPDEASDTTRLIDLLKASRATMLQATPVTFRSLLELNWQPPAGFKMLCGGEAWAPAMADQLLTTGGRLWNMYGPTETTVWSSIVEVRRGATRLPIGPPIANTRFYVLGEDLQPSASDEQGELCIAGTGVAKGYFDREELTAERFLPDPYVPGERMYRTGDGVRRTPDGQIEFIGRLDNQIKLRGFRIEPGEIECAMLAVAGVSEAAVLLRKDGLGEDVLAGFYVSHADVTPADLSRALRQRLPAYMVPRVYWRLETFPLTPNGKTDRRALAEVEIHSAPAAAATPDIPPSANHAGDAEVREQMLSIWQKIFPGETIGGNSDFFDLGGDSLLLVRLQSLIAKHLDLRLTIADVTQRSTFDGLVDWAEETRLSGDGPATGGEMNPGLLPLQSEGTGKPIFIIPQMLIFRTLAEELGHDAPVYALQIMDEDLAAEMESASFSELAGLYLRLIREAQPVGPYRLAGWCLWGWMAYEVAQLLETEGAEVEMLMIVDAWAPGYWSRYSPIRQFFVNASHFGQRIRWYADSMSSLSVPERVNDGLRRIRHFLRSFVEALPRGLLPELEIVETMRIQQFASKAAETYRPGPVKANVLLFKSELRPTGHFIGEDMGWGAVVGRPVRLDTLPGNHTEIFALPAARLMAMRVRSFLESQREGTTENKP